MSEWAPNWHLMPEYVAKASKAGLLSEKDEFLKLRERGETNCQDG